MIWIILAPISAILVLIWLVKAAFLAPKALEWVDVFTTIHGHAPWKHALYILLALGIVLLWPVTQLLAKTRRKRYTWNGF